MGRRLDISDGPTTSVYVLLADDDGTLRSTDTPFGVAVTTLAEAKRFVREGKVGYSHSYMKLRVFDDKDAALDHAFPELKGIFKPFRPAKAAKPSPVRADKLPTAAELIAKELGESDAP